MTHQNHSNESPDFLGGKLSSLKTEQIQRIRELSIDGQSTSVDYEDQDDRSNSVPSIDNQTLLEKEIRIYYEQDVVSNNDKELRDDDDQKQDDDIEPKLTYDRISNDVSKVLKNDTATCLSAYDKFFALGTFSGKVFIFDFQGDMWSDGCISRHRSAVNKISIDDRGEFIASVSDGQVIISEFHSSKIFFTATFDRLVKTISIDPQFTTSNSRKFLLSEADRILLYERNLLGRYKATCLQMARGIIRSSSWRQNFCAWASDLCVKIYDVQTRTLISHLDREKESDYRMKSELFQCSFCWRDDSTLLMAWYRSVKVLVIRQKPTLGNSFEPNLINSNGNLSKDLFEKVPKYFVELVFQFSLDNNLTACGVAPLENRILVLCLNKSLLVPQVGLEDLDERKKVRIKMIEPLKTGSYTCISNDILSPNDFVKTVTKSRDLSLCYCSENFYFVFSPKDLILAKTREEDDHIAWLLERGKFRLALERVKTKTSFKYSYESIATSYIQNLFEKSISSSGSSNILMEAAEICSVMCTGKRELWEQEILRFQKFHALQYLVDYLPTGRKFRNSLIAIEPKSKDETLLQPEIYHLVLEYFSEFDSIKYRQLIREWPSSIYSIAWMVNMTLHKLTICSNDKHLLATLGDLYTLDGRYETAFNIYIQNDNAKEVFDLIWKHQLLQQLQERLVELLKLDAEETSRLLIMNQDFISSEQVVARLRNHPIFLCTYLDRLIQRDMTAEYAHYHDMLFDLYATYEPQKIVSFLRQSNFVKFDKALDVCRKKNLTQAIVYILGRMGNTHEALRIIIDKMDDIHAAIEFCNEHGDVDLWEDLLDISVSKPRLLSTLLREVGTNATDPIGLIARIPEGLEVPDLMPSLVKILQDYRLQVTLEEGCRRVSNADCHNLFKKMYQMRSRAIVVKQADRYCHSCERSMPHDAMIIGDYVLFQCGHLFHTTCLFEENDGGIRVSNINDESGQSNIDNRFRSLNSQTNKVF